MPLIRYTGLQPRPETPLTGVGLVWFPGESRQIDEHHRAQQLLVARVGWEVLNDSDWAGPFDPRFVTFAELQSLAASARLIPGREYVVGSVIYVATSQSTFAADAVSYPGALGGVVYDVAGRAVEWTVDGVTFSVTYTPQGMTIQSSDGFVREVSFDPQGRIDAAQLLGT